MTSLYSAQRIAALSDIKGSKLVVEVVAETGSTNADLLARIDDMSSPVLLIAENQTAGRGRAGRVWHSEPGATLTFSLAWKFRQPLYMLTGLPLAVGTAVAEALNDLGIEACVKWPNDILRHGHKLAGILIEAAAEKGKPQVASWAVIGIGINLEGSDSLAAQVGRPIAGAEQLTGDRNVLMAALINNLTSALVQFEEKGLSPFIARWNRLHAYAGKRVAIMDGQQVLQEGQAVGIDDAGRLLVDGAGGRVAILAGDVSLRSSETL